MIETLIERFNSLTLRERTILLATVVFIVWGTWDKFVYQPITSKQKQLTDELSEIKIQLSTQEYLATEIEALGKKDPNQANKIELKTVKAELKKLKQQLGLGEKKFVPASLMAKVLGDMLKQNNELKLIQLETLPVTTLSESNQIQSWVYRHGLSITLSGNYLSTLNYLKSLESLPWRFNWDAIDFQVKKYPVAETVLRVYTLSFEENWLGL